MRFRTQYSWTGLTCAAWLWEVFGVADMIPVDCNLQTTWYYITRRKGTFCTPFIRLLMCAALKETLYVLSRTPEERYTLHVIKVSLQHAEYFNYIEPVPRNDGMEKFVWSARNAAAAAVIHKLQNRLSEATQVSHVIVNSVVVPNVTYHNES